jgi:hypothetical protein
VDVDISYGVKLYFLENENICLNDYQNAHIASRQKSFPGRPFEAYNLSDQTASLGYTVRLDSLHGQTLSSASMEVSVLHDYTLSGQTISYERTVLSDRLNVTESRLSEYEIHIPR